MHHHSLHLLLAQINRQLFAEAVATSALLADSGEMAQARRAVEQAIEEIAASSSYCRAMKDHTHRNDSEDLSGEGLLLSASVAFVEELQGILDGGLSSELSYRRGGRASLHETGHTFTRQRSAYTRLGRSNVNQSEQSIRLQRQASRSKSSFDI